MKQHSDFLRAAAAIKNAEGMVIAAGAGMGVDSGLPDFRGDRGFWNAYPAYEKLGVNFIGAANPEHFERDAAFAWGFYGHRANLYRQTTPHQGFDVLLGWIDRRGLDYFVVTSNVDNQFQKAKFDSNRIVEVHGSIEHLQCTDPCTRAIWRNEENISVDLATMRAINIPKCPRCGHVARPNILMFGDDTWIPDRTSDQANRFNNFLATAGKRPLVVVELGAGVAVPTIRGLSEGIGTRRNATVIRINPRESHIAEPHISLSCGALEGLSKIAAIVEGSLPGG